MSNIEAHIEFVKQQIAFHEKRAAELPGQLWRKNIHLQTAEKFKTLLNNITTMAEQVNSGAARRAKNLSLQLTPDDIEGLPPELIAELSISDGDRTDFAVLSLVQEAGGIIALDKLIVGLYKKTGEIHKREKLLTRLYRMIQKGLLFSVPTKKGVYSAEEITQEQLESLLNQSS